MSKKMILYLLFPMLGWIAFYGCFSDIGSNQQDQDQYDFLYEDCGEILIDETAYNTAQVDPFEIEYAYIKDDTLNVIVKYGGGCGFADFELITNGFFMESHPVQLNMILSLTDDDPCEALIQRQVCYDISQLAVLYNDSYQTNEGTIILHLNNYDSELSYDF
jgi:hypothetical protein